MAIAKNITAPVTDTSPQTVFALLAPANGGKSPAQWRVNAEGVAPIHATYLSASGRAGKNQNYRDASILLTVPHVKENPQTKVKTVIGKTTFIVQAHIYQGVESTEVEKGVNLLRALLANADLKENLSTGFAPQ